MFSLSIIVISTFISQPTLGFFLFSLTSYQLQANSLLGIASLSLATTKK